MRRALAVLCWLAVMPAGAEEGALLEQRLQAHIEFLAADELRGRQPGTPGYDIAANYVASQFQQIGLLPAGSDGSYFQPVPLRSAWLQKDSARMVLEQDGESRSFVFIEEFYLGPDAGREFASVTAEMVFAGYGIHAPPLEYSDIDQIDVKGKIVVTLAGQPHDFPSEEGAHFASGREKARALADRGALGQISIYTPRTEKRFEWDRVRSRIGKPSMKWIQADGTVFPDFAPVEIGAIVHYRPAAGLFDGSPYALEQLLALDQAGEGIPVFPMKGLLTLTQRSRHEDIASPNVAGILPGSDPVIGDEVVLYSAHLDHVGELRGDGHEDAIHNGALDNAAGVSVMIETARMFAEGPAPRRSALFLAVTAEEKGLVGSEYFAVNPTVEKDHITAVINLDMPLLLYDFADLIAFGAEHSSLAEPFQQAVAEFDTSLTPDPMPEQNVFVRSDHYRFVQQGVPSIFLVTGISSRDPTENVLDIIGHFRKDLYHRPGDEYGLPINYRAGARFTRINARAGEIIANDTKRASWHEGDFFGETYGR